MLVGAGSLWTVHGADLKVLLVTGHDPHGHSWKETTPVLKAVLAKARMFDVEVMELTSTREARAFSPDFEKYGVVVVVAHGLDWSEATQGAFETYLENGGGLVVVHNAVGQFGSWPAYRAMIGIGPGSRDDGVGFAFDEEKQSVLQIPAGEGAKQNGHGRQHEWVVRIRDAEHPITAGLPHAWMHTRDELYHGFRGKPEDVKHLKVLATAFSAKETGGTGAHEPVLMVNAFGKGRIFHMTLGHSPVSMSCAGFQTVFLRGTEWAAAGTVTQAAVPADFPTARAPSVRPVRAIGPDDSVQALDAGGGGPAKILFIGGADSHDSGEHDHKAGATLLKHALDAAGNVKGTETVLYLDRLPEDLTELADASAIVLMWEGWEQHLFRPGNAEVLRTFGALMERGVGLLCLHAATAVGDEAEKGYLKWSGGNKKLQYSTHPMMKDVTLSMIAPGHPICRGVNELKFPVEEFYRRILFDASAGTITPILTTGPPGENAEDQVVAWAFERAGGGRTFCCTGPHYHASLENADFRRILLNAVLWVAGIDVPPQGVSMKSIDKDDPE